MRTAFFVTLIAFFVRLAFAVPPGCLLHALNTQDAPSNMSAVCGNGALDVQSYMANNCGQYEEIAQKAFVDTCSSAGTSVAVYTATSSSSSTKSSSPSSGAATGLITSTTAHITGSGSSSNSASASKSGTGSPISSTAGANIDHRQAALSPMAAAAIALIGAVAAL